MTTRFDNQKSQNGASRFREFGCGRSWLEIGLVVVLITLFILTWIYRGRDEAVIFVWGGFWGVITLMIIEARDKVEKKTELAHRHRPTQPGMIVMPKVKVKPEDVDLGGMPSPPSQVSLDRLKEAILDESAISTAEDAYTGMLPAAQDPWDDTGFAEPMIEAVAAAFDWAIDEVMNP